MYSKKAADVVLTKSFQMCITKNKYKKKQNIFIFIKYTYKLCHAETSENMTIHRIYYFNIQF